LGWWSGRNALNPAPCQGRHSLELARAKLIQTSMNTGGFHDLKASKEWLVSYLILSGS
jgi:hypothetical protein